MSKYKEPVENTCPLIDQVIGMIYDVENARRSEPVESLVDACKILEEKYHDLMEEIRSANSSLREWGNDLAYDLKKSEDEINDLKDEIMRKDEELELLENELMQAELQSPR